MSVVGIIGGSGLYDLPGLTQVRERRLSTPFGPPSDVFRIGRLGDSKVVFLARHGQGHRLLPGEINARANVYGFKVLGCERLISFSAVGSLREEMAPGHVVLPDQAIDRTNGRAQTFFGGGVVAHVGFADPTCAELRLELAEAARAVHAPAVHTAGTLVVMEGPAFSTRAESNFHRSIGASLIGMTMLPEAKLAREAELCYATVGLVTDYDCWHDGHADVTVEGVLTVMKANAELARRMASEAVLRLVHMKRTCGCKEALKNAILTSAEMIPSAARRRLGFLLEQPLPPARTAKVVRQRLAARRSGKSARVPRGRSR